MGFLKDLLIGGVQSKLLLLECNTLVWDQSGGLHLSNPNVKETSQFQRAQLLLIDGSSIGINSYLRNNQR